MLPTNRSIEFSLRRIFYFLCNIIEHRTSIYRTRKLSRSVKCDAMACILLYVNVFSLTRACQKFKSLFAYCMRSNFSLSFLLRLLLCPIQKFHCERSLKWKWKWKSVMARFYLRFRFRLMRHRYVSIIWFISLLNFCYSAIITLYIEEMFKYVRVKDVGWVSFKPPSIDRCSKCIYLVQTLNSNNNFRKRANR